MKRLPLATLAVALLLSACTGGDQDPGPSGPSSAAPSASASKELTVVVHESFSLPDDLKAAFEEQTGYRVTYLTQDASIALVNQLVLTKDAPLGDAVYGIDNTSSARAVAEGVLADYLSPALTDPVPGLEPQPGLTPIDFGDVCINADVAWFEEKLTNASYGETRGSGVVRLIDGQWKIEQYVLSFSVPNDASRAVVEAIAAQKAGAAAGRPGD